jgi:pimeloyl-ACP methyl ester carboxylesterase
VKIVANGISQNYEITGNGKWLTLIHGAGDNLDMWWNQVPAFSSSYRLLTYDVRGYGQTEIPTEGYSMNILVEDLYQLLKVLGINETYVLGYSMGGRVAIGFTVAHPEIVKTLICANSPLVLLQRSAEQMKEMARLREERMKAMEKQGAVSAAQDFMTMVFSPGWPRKHKDVIDHHKKIRLRNDPNTSAIAMRSMIINETPPDVSSIKCPKLIIGGEHDGLMGVEIVKAGQALVSGSQLKMMPTGHAAAIEMPDEFNTTVLKFLASVDK